MRLSSSAAALDRPRGRKRADRGEVQVDALEREQREEQVALLAGDERHEAARLRGLRLDERDRVELDVGVFADLVRVGVVPRVLRHPPGVADADDAGGDRAAGAVVGRAGLEHLAVGGLVGEERELREDQAERTRDEQLEPGVAEQDEPGDGAAEGDEEDAHEHQVEPARAAQKAGLANYQGEGAVTPRDISGAGAGLRRPDRTEGFGVRDVCSSQLLVDFPAVSRG